MEEYVRVAVTFGVDKAARETFMEAYGQRPWRHSDNRVHAHADHKIYHYKASKELGLKEGDFAVVASPTHGLTVVTVKGVEDYEFNAGKDGYKWIIDKVDITVHKEREERAKEKARLMRELTRMADEAKKRIDFNELLSDNPEAVEMLKRLRALG